MMHVDGFDTDGARSHEGGLNLIEAPKGDVLKAHTGTFRGETAAVLVSHKERWRYAGARRC